MIAWQGEGEIVQRAYDVIEDVDREFIVSDYLELELLPKPIFHDNNEEIDFYKVFLDDAVMRIESSPQITQHAIALASQYNLGVMDAIHYAVACEAGVEEFITAEKPTKPFFDTTELNVSTIYVE